MTVASFSLSSLLRNFGTLRPRHHSTHKTARALCCEPPKVQDRSLYACVSSIQVYWDGPICSWSGFHRSCAKLRTSTTLLTYLTLGKKRTTPESESSSIFRLTTTKKPMSLGANMETQRAPRRVHNGTYYRPRPTITATERKPEQSPTGGWWILMIQLENQAHFRESYWWAM